MSYYEDAEDELELAALRERSEWFRMRALPYRREVDQLEAGWYWHVFYRDERINGGLSETWTDAMSDAWTAITRHIYGYGSIRDH